MILFFLLLVTPSNIQNNSAQQCIKLGNLSIECVRPSGSGQSPGDETPYYQTSGEDNKPITNRAHWGNAPHWYCR